MARCNDCNKFVSYDAEIEPEEEESLSVSGDKDGYAVEGSFRRVLGCAECGAELRAATIELSEDVDLIEPPEPSKGGEESEDEGEDKKPISEEDAENPLFCKKSRDGSHDFEVEDYDVEPTVRAEGRGRGMRTFYGVKVVARLCCSKCGATAEVTLSGSEQASNFEEC